MILYETNVDDMDPRLVPHVIEQLLAAGANDAWVTPILMKKGRPAFMLSAICETAHAEETRAVFFRETSTIGLRELNVVRHTLDRNEEQVEVDGQPIRIKNAFDGGELVNRSVEWEDVIAAARESGLSAKEVLAAATAAAREVQ